MKKQYGICRETLAVFTLLLAAMTFTPMVYANKVDSLKTDADVVTFLQSINENFRSPKYDKIELRSSETLRQDLPCDGVAAQWQVKNWEKADFNEDGRTDLLVILYWYNYGVYAVMDKGNGSFELLTLSYNVHDPCTIARPIQIMDHTFLAFYGKNDVLASMGPGQKPGNKLDTLVYRQGDFVELNMTPAAYQVDSIQFRTTYCFGSCPVFTISIAHDGTAAYVAEAYNPKKGKFSGTIASRDLQDILQLINYLSIDKLRDNYSVSWTDDQTVWVRVRFADGTVKEIRDYGLRGTFGLRLLYNKFFALRTNQQWK